MSAAFVFAALAVTHAAACAASIFVLSDSAGAYLVDTTSGAVLASYGSVFNGSGAQDIAQDLQGNLYVTTTAGVLEKSTFTPTGAPYFSAATTIGTPTNSGNTLPSVARLAFDPTSLYCTNGCLVTFYSATVMWWIDPATANVVKTLTTSGPAIATGGDIVVVPTAANNETIYVVQAQKLYTVNATSGVATGPVTLSGPTGSLTGAAVIPNGDLVACEQIASGSPWTLWEYTTAGASVTSHTGIATGSDVVNDLASIPATFTVTKSGTTSAGPGDSVDYFVTLTNTSFFALPSAGITDPLPANMIPSATILPTCTVTGSGTCTVTSALGASTATASVANLGVGSSAKLTIVAAPNAASGSATNTARGSVPFDPNEYGGDTLATNPVTTSFTAANLAKQITNVTQGLGPSSTSVVSNPGDIIKYTMTFTNNRGFAISSFTIQDAVPANMTYVAASATCVTTPSPLTCAAVQSGGNLTFTYSGGTLAAGASAVVSFQTKVN